MRILKHRESYERTSYNLSFDYDGHTGWGFAFPCDAQGNPMELAPAAQENLDACLAGTNGTHFAGIQEYTYTEHDPMVIECDCGAHLWLYDDTECACGRMYNTFGQELQYIDRAGWEALGGESYCGEHWDEED